MRHIVIMLIVFKCINCARKRDINGNLKKSNVKVTAEGEIFIATDQNINDDDVKSLLEEKYKFFNDNTSKRYKTMDSDEQQPDDENGAVFRAVPERRIIGGMQTSIRMYPYNVAISRNGKHWCGGSIVDEQWVLTAGHCMESAHDGDKKKLNPFIVRAGSSFHDKGGYQARINKAFFPDGYVPGHADFDFSLIRLDRPMPIGRNIAVINLPSSKYKIISDDMLVVTGWGSTDVSGVGNVPPRLRFVPVPVISPAQCQGFYTFYITPRMLCAGYKTGGMDACNHDSGGPAMRDGVLIGVVSFGGKKCGDPRSPGVYSRVSKMTDWVEKTITNNEAHLVPELQKKIEKARQREGELQTFEMQIENKKEKIKKWLREMLRSAKFIEKAKKKLIQVGIDINSRRSYDEEEVIDDEKLDDINLTNLITEGILGEDIGDEEEMLIRILALYEMTSSNKSSLINFTENIWPIIQVNESVPQNFNVSSN